jgi:nucleotide-binding universal stress UspA family protein
VTNPGATPTPFIESVLHATDFSKTSEAAFAHALAISLIRQTRLTLLHAATEPGSWTSFPGVRATLERWGLLEPGSPRSAVFEQLRVRVKRVRIETDRVVAGMLEFLEREPADLLVLGTEGRDGPARFLRRSVAEPVARQTRTRTLFVPRGAPGFVDFETGRLSLRRILVPIHDTPPAGPAIVYATRAAGALGGGQEAPVEIGILRVDEGGGAAQASEPVLPRDPRWHFTQLERSGAVVDGIDAAARDFGADLVIMATAGQDGVLDALRGTTTEQVLRRLTCPLLAVPAA